MSVVAGFKPAQTDISGKKTRIYNKISAEMLKLGRREGL